MKIVVGMGTCGIAAGAQATWKALRERAAGSGFELGVTGCAGLCWREPLVEVRDADGGRFQYGEVTPEKVERLLAEHLVAGKVVEDWLVWSNRRPGSDQAFLERQDRIVLRHCGELDPESLDDALARGAYAALERTVKANDPESLIACVTESGLRGRGGAGFSTGMKWRLTRLAAGARKFVVCNADEGDPGAFMDRSVLESDPHAVLEGMALAGFAIGAREGFVYVRAEYPKAIERLQVALAQAEARGVLGERLFGSDFSFRIAIEQGAGAFVCGEETALIASLEGRRGMPRVRPPFPATRGLWGCPTCINNVETLANVPWIVREGAAAFAAKGIGKSRGTKVFALAGRVKRGGLVEVPMGISIREIVFEVCGGIKDGKKFKAVQMGGPSGGCIPAELQETVIDYESIARTGAIMGSGGLVVMDETTCMVDVARFFLEFTQRESCGKCTFCRIGTKRMLEILTRLTEGRGLDGDLERLEQLAGLVKANSLCGLGQTAPNPVLTTLKYFRSEYEAHLVNRTCPAKHCRALLTWSITDACNGCGACVRACKVGAISGAKRERHRIDAARCTHCDACFKACRFEAVARA